MPYVKAVRDAVKGAPFVKAARYTYLPHPSEIDKSTAEAQARYKQYLAGAEFDEFPKQTLVADTGKLKLNSIAFGEQFRDELEYLKDDSDGDGLSLNGLARSMFRNVAQVKWHIALADINGLPDVGEMVLSLEDVQMMQESASIKQYSRESLWDYRFAKVNGKNQLTRLVLKETYREYADSDELTTIYTDKEIYLTLALDEEGNYYQQKQVDGELGERNYPLLGGNEPIKFIPVEIVCDEEIEVGELPQELGYLSPICDLAYSRYVASADYKEAMRDNGVTKNVTGMTAAKKQLFDDMNGREYYATGSGSVNLLPDGVTVDLLSANNELGFYERYFENNAAKARAIGASFETDDKSDETATATNINNFNKTARLNGAVDSIEESLTRLIAYCGMFNGLFTQDQILNDFDSVIEQCQVVLPRDFASAKLSEAEMRAYGEAVLSGILPKLEYIKIMVRGGRTISDVDAILEMLESQPPTLV